MLTVNRNEWGELHPQQVYAKMEKEDEVKIVSCSTTHSKNRISVVQSPSAWKMFDWPIFHTMPCHPYDVRGNHSSSSSNNKNKNSEIALSQHECLYIRFWNNWTIYCVVEGRISIGTGQNLWNQSSKFLPIIQNI